MAVLNDYLTRKILYDNHPVPLPGRCLNEKQSRSLCTKCRDVCPEGVFEKLPWEDGPGAESGVDWTLCSGCDLCVSACPARALRSPRTKMEKLLSLASHSFNSITISCISGQKSDYFTEYPGSVPWEYLSLLSLRGEVTILVGHCAECEKKTCRESLGKNLEQVHAFLEGSGFEQNICVTQEPEKGSSRCYTRREAIAHILHRTGRTAVSLLPLPEDESADSIFWRRLLARSVSGTTRWLLPRFTERCTACGVCVRMCPAGALLRAPGPEGSGRFYMALIPWKCTGCGLCGTSCPVGGLEPPAQREVNDPQTPLLHAVAASPCSRCGEPVPAGSGSALCAGCTAETVYRGK